MCQLQFWLCSCRHVLRAYYGCAHASADPGADACPYTGAHAGAYAGAHAGADPGAHSVTYASANSRVRRWHLWNA